MRSTSRTMTVNYRVNESQPLASAIKHLTSLISF